MSHRSDKAEEVDAVSSELMQTNVVGNIHLFHLFLPLVLKGEVKKVIAISTGLADLDLTNDCDVDIGALYAASKAALNVIVAKFNAQYKKDGVLFLSISPGLVEVGRNADGTYPFVPSRLQLPDVLLMHTHSHIGRAPGLDGIRRQTRNICASLQGPDLPGRVRPTCSIHLGEGQHREWVWWCVCFAFWKQAVGVNSGCNSLNQTRYI
jgi:NAD(P)-dependent dehydrogenase (short-subunit alcohol dehydrogenase family)